VGLPAAIIFTASPSIIEKKEHGKVSFREERGPKGNMTRSSCAGRVRDEEQKRGD